MPYVDADSGKRRWVSERRTEALQDPLRRASEQLAKDVESFLYDQDSGVWMKPEFLAWAVARYDYVKSGSGHHGQDFGDYSVEAHNEAAVKGYVPDPKRDSATRTPYRGIRFPEEAVEAGYAAPIAEPAEEVDA